MALFTLSGVLLGLTVLYIIKQLLFKTTQAPLPPGPKGKPLIGNLGDLPPPGTKDWEHWARFKELYGPISSVSLFGQTMVILNDAQMAFDLMEKRSGIYSSRPQLVFAGEMMGWENSMGLQPYCPRFRAYRKAVHRVLGSNVAIARFNQLQDAEVRRFLLRVLERPDDLVQHIRTEAGAVILKITYGYTVEPHGRDPLVDLADDSIDKFSMATVPGRWLVDVVPFLKRLPTWLPGTGFKRTAEEWRKTTLETFERPYLFVREQMRQGNYPQSYLSSLLEEASDKGTDEKEFVAKWTAGSLYGAGADTTVSALSCFFLAMSLYPEVQRKAQEEIDHVLGPTNLPSFADRERLPYVEAIVKETFRWHPVAPMGLPHLSQQDDIYEGYRIPKDSVIMPNIWAFTHDPNVYPEAMTFKPERFLATPGQTPEVDPRTLIFGFGRRICPGRQLVDNTIFLSIAQSLAVFDLSTEDTTEPQFLPGVASHPAQRQLTVKPRSEVHEGIIRGIEAEAA